MVQVKYVDCLFILIHIDLSHCSVLIVVLDVLAAVGLEVVVEVAEVSHQSLKALDTFGNCQRHVFSLGVSQHMHTKINLYKFGLNWSFKLQKR